jgi:hypothetical protein
MWQHNRRLTNEYLWQHNRRLIDECIVRSDEFKKFIPMPYSLSAAPPPPLQSQDFKKFRQRPNPLTLAERPPSPALPHRRPSLCLCPPPFAPPSAAARPPLSVDAAALHATADPPCADVDALTLPLLARCRLHHCPAAMGRLHLAPRPSTPAAGPGCFHPKVFFQFCIEFE